MPALLEVQTALYRSLVTHDDAPAIQHIVIDGLAPEARLNIYRNTFVGSLTTAVRLSYPAVHRLVGAEFFEGAARIFIESNPPQSAYLDLYGREFPAFLERFPPAASLPYLPGIARLEWAVARALHAPDTEPLNVANLTAIPTSEHGRLWFVPHPSISLVHAAHPVDAIWRAVLASDASALAQVDLKAGPVWLLVERLHTSVSVTRTSETAWRFLSALCAPRPLEDAIKAAGSIDVCAALAEHLVAGRFAGFRLADQPKRARPLEATS
jgi:hypothetical protein